MPGGLSQSEADFVTGVSNGTGIDPRVIIAWDRAEGAYPSPPGTGGFNYLNLRPYPGDPYTGISGGNFELFSSVKDAEAATIRRLHQPFAAGIINVANAHGTPREEITAIAASGWDSGHYGGAGGPKLQGDITAIFGKNVLDDQYESPAAAQAVASTAGTGSAADAGSYDANNAVHDATKAITEPIKFAEDAYAKLTDSSTWIRVGLFVIGGGLILVGLVKAFDLPTPAPIPI